MSVDTTMIDAQPENNVALSMELFSELLKNAQLLARLMGAIDTIEATALRDQYMPIESVLFALGRKDAAQIIAERKGA